MNSTKILKNEKKYSKKEYEKHGNIMFNIGKSEAFKSILKTEVEWSVKMPDDHWDLNTIIIGDGSLKDIPFYKEVLTDDQDHEGSFIRTNVKSIAKDGTVKEVWLAADRAYKEAVKLYDDWHYFLEIVELRGRRNKCICSFYGS
tara:strand:+ start:222 stop:653 length:432 start_codon:yes stop_codon:yes gene_type:complete